MRLDFFYHLHVLSFENFYMAALSKAWAQLKCCSLKTTSALSFSLILIHVFSSTIQRTIYCTFQQQNPANFLWRKISLKIFNLLRSSLKYFYYSKRVIKYMFAVTGRKYHFTLKIFSWEIKQSIIKNSVKAKTLWFTKAKLGNLIF